MNKLELQKKSCRSSQGHCYRCIQCKERTSRRLIISKADLFTYLYFEEMNVDPKNPEDENRDRFVLSKGHTAPGYYAKTCVKRLFSQ